MRSGSLDRKITLHAPETLTYNEYNGPILTPGQTFEVRAHYEPISDAEKVAAAQVIASLEARFVVRWDSALQGMNAMWKVTFDGREFDCSGAKEIGRRRGIEITASARSDV